ncbi:hypothetical protein Gotri_015164 [Gossypium trilobum]|uniref:Uncharacterized protein n=1 Tax=Gossypium trilobum TaxID=34281 RepID=A0A7J9DZS5_9ROSI|nr:hypothetical protein [Gossypium trilobum]
MFSSIEYHITGVFNSGLITQVGGIKVA